MQCDLKKSSLRRQGSHDAKRIPAFAGMTRVCVVLVVLLLSASVAFAAPTSAPTEEDRKGMPENHKSSWLDKHQTYVKSDPKQCKMCHNSYFCMECHQRRDEILESVHRRNFKFYHSIEARANPRKCDTCHDTVFCVQCHQSPR